MIVTHIPCSHTTCILKEEDCNLKTMTPEYEEFEKLMAEKGTVVMTKLLFDGETQSHTLLIDSSKILDFIKANFISKSYIRQTVHGMKKATTSDLHTADVNQLSSTDMMLLENKGYNEGIEDLLSKLLNE